MFDWPSTISRNVWSSSYDVLWLQLEWIKDLAILFPYILLSRYLLLNWVRPAFSWCLARVRRQGNFLARRELITLQGFNPLRCPLKLTFTRLEKTCNPTLFLIFSFLIILCMWGVHWIHLIDQVSHLFVRRSSPTSPHALFLNWSMMLLALLFKRRRFEFGFFLIFLLLIQLHVLNRIHDLIEELFSTWPWARTVKYFGISVWVIIFHSLSFWVDRNCRIVST